MTVMLAAADVIRLVGANVGFRHSLIESGLSAYDNIADIIKAAPDVKFRFSCTANSKM